MVLVVGGISQADLSDGLVAYYPFDGNANDESGNVYHGTVNGASLTTDRNENPNSAYRFDGVNDYIETSYSPIVHQGDSSLNLWIKANTLQSNYPYIFGLERSDHQELSFIYRPDGTRFLQSLRQNRIS